MPNLNFAHLLGMGKKAKASNAEDDDEKTKKSKARKAEDEDQDDDNDDPDADEGDNDDPDADDGDNDDPDADDGDDDDPDAEDDEDDKDARAENKDVKKGRRAERKRCAAIFSSKFAAGQPDMAATLAFTTSMSPAAAIRVLKTSAGRVSAPARSATLHERMKSVETPNLGDGGNSGGERSTAQHAMALYNKVTGGKNG